MGKQPGCQIGFIRWLINIVVEAFGFLTDGPDG